MILHSSTRFILNLLTSSFTSISPGSTANNNALYWAVPLDHALGAPLGWRFCSHPLSDSFVYHV